MHVYREYWSSYTPVQDKSRLTNYRKKDVRLMNPIDMLRQQSGEISGQSKPTGPQKLYEGELQTKIMFITTIIKFEVIHDAANNEMTTILHSNKNVSKTKYSTASSSIEIKSVAQSVFDEVIRKVESGESKWQSLMNFQNDIAEALEAKKIWD